MKLEEHFRSLNVPIWCSVRVSMGRFARAKSPTLWLIVAIRSDTTHDIHKTIIIVIVSSTILTASTSLLVTHTIQNSRTHCSPSPAATFKSGTTGWLWNKLIVEASSSIASSPSPALETLPIGDVTLASSSVELMCIQRIGMAITQWIYKPIH